MREPRYLPVRGMQLYYETEGEGEPVLLLHGGLGTIDDFASQIPDLSRYYHVVAFERPGHGHTADTGGQFSYSAMAEQTVAFIEALGLSATNLVGWSDGAIVALLVAISRQDLVKGLVAISGNFNVSGLTARASRWIESTTAESFMKSAPERVKRYQEASPDGPNHFSVAWEKTKRLWLSEPDIQHEELGRIRAPTLVMAGDRDMVSIEHTVELAKSVKGACLCIVPGATHFLTSEKPEIVNSVILDFLRGGCRRA